MKFFDNISIGTKFLCSSLLIAGVFTLISWMSISTIENCHKACHMLINGAIATKSLTQDAQSNFYALAEQANQLMFRTHISLSSAQNSEAVQRFETQAVELSSFLDTVIQALKADPFIEPAVIAKLTAQVGVAQTALTTSYAPLVRSLLNARADNAEELDAGFQRSQALSLQIAQDIGAVSQRVAQEGDTIFNNYVIFLLGTIRNLKLYDAIAVAFSLLLMVFIAFAIKKPFTIVMNSLKEIMTDWNLTRQISLQSKDEVGSLSAFINLTFEKMRALLLVIKNIIQSLSATGVELSMHSSRTASSVNEITAAIKSMKAQIQTQADKVYKTNGAMERILSNVEKLNTHIDSQSQSVSQSSSSIEEMLANIHSVGETLSENAVNVASLSQAAEIGRRGIEKVTADIQEIAREGEDLAAINAVIQDIAGRTNLLSMNAAIEASHAGESGKGFAVVAAEIRKLSESSGEQSHTINAVLQKIKKSIEVITESSGLLVKGFQSISEGVRIVSNQESEVRSAMGEQEAGSQIILEEIGKLKTITDLVKTSSADIAAQGRQVKQQSLVLEQITGEISNSVDDIALGAELITTTANHVNDISAGNRRSIETLSKEISKFKTG